MVVNKYDYTTNLEFDYEFNADWIALKGVSQIEKTSLVIDGASVEVLVNKKATINDIGKFDYKNFKEKQKVLF